MTPKGTGEEVVVENLSMLMLTTYEDDPNLKDAYDRSVFLESIRGDEFSERLVRDMKTAFDATGRFGAMLVYREAMIRRMIDARGR